MANVYELPVIDAAFQQFETVLNGVPVSISLAHNAFSDRWSMDIAVNGVPSVTGLRLVPGVDLVKKFNLGIGKIALIDWAKDGSGPGRAEVPAGKFRLFAYDELTA